MLDSLQSETNPCRALTQTWLTHAIQRNDIARIMEPVLLVLLHPDTARYVLPIPLFLEFLHSRFLADFGKKRNVLMDSCYILSKNSGISRKYYT